MKGSDITKIIGGLVGTVVKFFDTAYNEGWMLYLIGGIVILFILIILN